MESKISKQIETKNPESKTPEEKNFEIVVNHLSFTTALTEFVTLVKNKSLENTFDQKNIKLVTSHKRLRETCTKLIAGFSNDGGSEDFDQGRIIKKIYKTLSTHIDKLLGTTDDKGNYTSDVTLFTIRNDEGKIVTIIPGLDVNLVIGLLTPEELKSLWGYLYIIFISSVRMISTINKHKQEGNIWNTLPIFQARVTKLGLTAGTNKKLFNPYVGLTSDTTLDVSTMFAAVDDIKQPSAESMLGNLGLDINKLIDVDKLNEALKNIGQDDINEATKHIVSVLGASGDNDTSSVYATLVNDIVDDLKTNGLTNMFETAQSVSKKAAGKVDRNQMTKAAMGLSNFMKNGEEQMKQMKDDKGNPLGADIMKTLETPMNLISAMMNMNKK